MTSMVLPLNHTPSLQVMNHVACKGTERDLSRCTYDVATECKSKRAVKVKCIGASPPARPPTRLPARLHPSFLLVV